MGLAHHGGWEWNKREKKEIPPMGVRGLFYNEHIRRVKIFYFWGYLPRPWPCSWS